MLERTFAEALGVGVGDRVTLNGRAFRVAGIAVTAAGRRTRTSAITPAAAASSPCQAPI